MQDNGALASPARVASVAKAFLVAGVAVLCWFICRYSDIKPSAEDTDVLSESNMAEASTGDFSTWEPEL